MNLIPEDIEKLIFDYKDQIDHVKKFKKSLKKIKKIVYKINPPTIGIDITSIISQRDNTWYSIINSETIHRFMAETEDTLTTIIIYHGGEKIIYHLGVDEVD